jgi:hypothetical protein
MFVRGERDQYPGSKALGRQSGSAEIKGVNVMRSTLGDVGFFMSFRGPQALRDTYENPGGKAGR